MKTVISKTVQIDHNSFFVFNDRMGNRCAFHVSEISALVVPINIDGKDYEGSATIRKSEYPETYPLNVLLDSGTGNVAAIEILETVHNEQQRSNYLH